MTKLKIKKFLKDEKLSHGKLKTGKPSESKQNVYLHSASSLTTKKHIITQ